MSNAGRKPVPTAMKVLRGNPGRRPINKNEPKPKTGVPRCPAWLTPAGKKAFREMGSMLNDLGVMTEADKMALTLLCDAYAEYMEARAVIAEKGSTYETDRGTAVRPEVKIAQDAWKRVRGLLPEFGLSPSSRTKITVAEIKEDNPFEAYLKRKPGTPPPGGSG